MGLSLILNADIDNYFCSSTRSYGFKILMHNPIELPKVNEYGVSIPIGYESRIVIIPSITEASKAIRKISRNVRRCIFESENFLEYYRLVY